jgi:hypothetical protein
MWMNAFELDAGLLTRQLAEYAMQMVESLPTLPKSSATC